MSTRLIGGLKAALVGVAVLLCGPTLNAGTLTGTFSVTATVSGSACSSISATALSFGTVAPSGAAFSTSTITVNCGSGTPYTITGAGANPGCATAGTTASLVGNVMSPFNASNPTSPMYVLFKDSAHTLGLSAGAALSCGSLTGLTGTGSGAAQTLTLYGYVQGSATGSGGTPGNYTDTATLTLSF